MNLARFHVAVEPAIDGLEGDAKLLGELRLTKPMLEAVSVELINEILGHGKYEYDITSYRVCQRES